MIPEALMDQYTFWCSNLTMVSEAVSDNPSKANVGKPTNPKITLNSTAGTAYPRALGRG